eukprot:5629824-Pyramimonas_sp.AAC.1
MLKSPQMIQGVVMLARKAASQVNFLALTPLAVVWEGSRYKEMMSSEVPRMWRVTGVQSHMPMSSYTPRASDVVALETVLRLPLCRNDVASRWPLVRAPVPP